jgi:hypothetical protein
MATTKTNPNQGKEDTLEDADGNTKVQVEEAADENKIRFDTAGTERMIIDADGKVGIGTSSPSTVLHAYADASNTYVATIDNDQSSAGHGLKVTSDGNGSGTYLLDLEAASTTVFRFRADGRFGIGTTTPGQVLTVEGDIGVGTQIVHKGDSDTFIEFDTDEISIECGGRQMIKMVEDVTDKITINNGGMDVDLQIKGENEANLIRTDAGNDKVGLRTSSPSELLTLGGADDSAAPYLAFTEGDADRAKIGINSSNNLEIHQQYTNKHIVFKVNDAGTTREALRMDGAVPEVVVNQTGDSLVDFRVESDNNTHMLFVDGSADFVGINTSTPGSGLHIAHSISLPTGGSPKTGAYSLTATDFCVVADCNSSAFTITLPSATDAMAGRIYTIKRMDSGNSGGSNLLTISRNSKNIDNLAEDVVLANLDALVLQCIGVNGGWIRIGQFLAPMP